MPVQYTQRNPNAFSDAYNSERSNRLQDLAFGQQQQDREDQKAREKAADARVTAKDQQDLTDHERELVTTFYAPLAQTLIKAPDPHAALAQAFQNPAMAQIFKRDGIIDETDLQDPELPQHLQVLAGFGPKPVQYERQDGPRGSVLQRDPSTGELKQIVGPDNSQPTTKPAGSYRALNQNEIAAAGLPAGTSAQVGPDGKIDVISKRDNTAVLSQKDATTAKIKLNTVALARQQLNKIKEAFKEGTTGVNAFGPGQGYLPTQAGKKFDARVNQMRSTLTALTRVPGVGAMSDYETKLDQSKFPSRTAYESVTADTLQNLDDQLSLIENGYKTLLSGNGQEAAAPTTAAPAAPQQAAPVRVSTPAEAARLPSGTHFITPDGQTRVKR